MDSTCLQNEKGFNGYGHRLPIGSCALELVREVDFELDVGMLLLVEFPLAAAKYSSHGHAVHTSRGLVRELHIIGEVCETGAMFRRAAIAS